MNIPDPIERLEAFAERWSDENIYGDSFKCDCGEMCELKDGQSIDLNPYAPPVCSDCFKEWFDSQIKRKNNGRHRTT